MKEWEVRREGLTRLEASLGRVHILPRGDAIDHTLGLICWCSPTVQCDGRLYVHHSADGREANDPGALPPASRH